MRRPVRRSRPAAYIRHQARIGLSLDSPLRDIVSFIDDAVPEPPSGSSGSGAIIVNLHK